MMRPNAVCCVLVGVVLLAGCMAEDLNPPADDTIRWSADGDQVAFYHTVNREVLMAQSTGQGLRSVHARGRNAQAMSGPVWHPRDPVFLFTTAEPSNAEKGWKGIRYTCWRQTGVGGDGPPTELFTALCPTRAYVDLNVAVRWSADGKRVLFLDGSGEMRVALCEYDPATRHVRRVRERDAGGMVFDWTPDRSRLTCVEVDSGREPGRRSGVWIGHPDRPGSWRRLPGVHEDLALLDDPRLAWFIPYVLAGRRLVWTRDGTRFAFIQQDLLTRDRPSVCRIRVGRVSSNDLRTIVAGSEALTDLRWSPDGRRLGFVQGSRLWLTGRGESRESLADGVVAFGGWDVSGRWLTYTVRAKMPQGDPLGWPCMLVPEPFWMRHRVEVRDERTGATRTVFRDMHVRAMRWSPKDSRLSLWLTFMPSHRVIQLGWLGPGDPAAILDVVSGEVEWMAVNPFEHAQVGHHDLMSGRPAAALARYTRARVSSDDPAARPGLPRGLAVFEALALDRLGRAAEARQRRAEWRGDAPFEEDLFIAQVYLSLDAVRAGIALLGGEMAAARTDRVRLSRCVALSQLLLRAGNNAAYAELVTGTLMPLGLKHDLIQRGPRGPGADARWATGAVRAMFSRELLSCLPPGTLERLIPRWKAMRGTPRANGWVDRFLRAASRPSG